MELNEIQEKLCQQLSAKRMRHSLGVTETAMQLALRYGVPVEEARLAGLLHDYARDLPPETLLAVAEKAGLIGCPVDRLAPDLLHGPVAAWLIPQEFGINDPDILRAVAVHTLGVENMSCLDKIIYLADLIEPTRAYAGVEHLRALAVTDLDRAVYYGFNQTLTYCLQRNLFVHPQTILARNYLLVGGQTKCDL